MNLTSIPQEAFDSGLLSKDFHERLLIDLERHARKAGIPASSVWTGLSKFTTPVDLDWVRNFRISDDCGLVYVGKTNVPVSEKMMAIAGACLRNYTDARVMVVQEVIKRLKDGTLGSPTLLLIPNFCLDKTDGGDIASWDSTALLGMLLSRMSEGKKTVLHVSSMANLEKTYGEAFKEHLTSRYSLLQAGKIKLPATAH